jgi:hypothetical protein
MTFHDFNLKAPVATVPEHKARLIRDGITRNEYRSRFGMDEAAEQFFNRVDSERKLAERVARAVVKPAPTPRPTTPPVPAFTGYKPNENSFKARILAHLADAKAPLTARELCDRMGIEIRQVQRAVAELRNTNKVRADKMEGSATSTKVYSIIKTVEPKETVKPEVKVSDLYPTVKDIQAEVAEEFGITIEDILSSTRSQKFAFPRFAAIYLCREFKPKMSYPDLSDRFGFRDHTSIMNADRRARQLVIERPDFGGKVRNVWARISEKTARGKK